MLPLLMSVALGCSCEVGSSLYQDGVITVGTNAWVLFNHAGESPPEDGRLWLARQDDRDATYELVSEGDAFSDGYGTVQLYRPVELLPANTRFVPSEGGGVVITGAETTEYGAVVEVPVVSRGEQPSRVVVPDEEDSCGSSYRASWQLGIPDGHWAEIEVLDERDALLHQWLTPYEGFSYGQGFCNTVGSDLRVSDRPRVRARLVSFGGIRGPWTQPIGTDYVDVPDPSRAGCQMTQTYGGWWVVALAFVGLAGALSRRAI
ncbi:MAG: hypothetical protein ACJAZO_002425 [Myxococcota bacterium]|jgi:hypothetical protein